MPPKRKATTEALSAESPNATINPDAAVEPPAKRKRAAKKPASPAAEVPPANGDPISPSKPRRAKKPSSPAQSELTEESPLSSLDDEPAPKPKKARKPRAPKPEPVYVIPDVETLPTSYKGRLGYACLNTITRKLKPNPVFCSRTCRIDTIKQKGMEYLKELGRQNMKDLIQLIEWNEQNNIKFMRMSSEMFPFASHPEYGYTLEYAQEELTAAGDLAKKYGHRLTTHPGQFTQLGSPRDVVVTNAYRDLNYHAEMIDRMGLGPESVMIIHGGGVFGDKAATLERFKANYAKCSDTVKARLVLENDEICYSVDDLLPVCEELNIPLVYDYHHGNLLPSAQSVTELMPRILATWTRKNIKPKQHLSEPRAGAVSIMELRAHSDRCQRLPEELPDDMDLMIEAKDKEQAVLHLYRIYQLQPVIHASLRPPADKEDTQTKGRKKAKTKLEPGDDVCCEEDATDEAEHDHSMEDEKPAKKPKKAAATPKRKAANGKTKTPISKVKKESSPPSEERSKIAKQVAGQIREKMEKEKL